MNPNLKPDDAAKQIAKLLGTSKTIEKVLMPRIKMWLQSTVFLDTKSPDADRSLRIIFLQMLYQVIEFDKENLLFKKNEWNLQFIRDEIDRMISDHKSEDVVEDVV